MIAGNNSGVVEIWSLEDGAARKTAELKTDGALTLGLSSDGTTLATIGWWQIVRLWDLTPAQPVELFPPRGHLGWVTCLDLSSDGRRLVSGGADGSVRLWDLSGPAPREVQVLPPQQYEVRRVRIAPDGESLAAGYPNRTFLFDLSGRQIDATPIEGMPGHQLAYWFNPQSQFAAALTFEGDGILKLWSVSGERPTERRFPQGQPRSSWQTFLRTANA